MPKQRFSRHTPTHDWQQLRPLLKDPTQLTYKIIRPVILGWVTPRERSAETGSNSHRAPVVVFWRLIENSIISTCLCMGDTQRKIFPFNSPIAITTGSWISGIWTCTNQVAG